MTQSRKLKFVLSFGFFWFLCWSFWSSGTYLPLAVRPFLVPQSACRCKSAFSKRASSAPSSSYAFSFLQTQQHTHITICFYLCLSLANSILMLFSLSVYIACSYIFGVNVTHINLLNWIEFTRSFL